MLAESRVGCLVLNKRWARASALRQQVCVCMCLGGWAGIFMRVKDPCCYLTTTLTSCHKCDLLLTLAGKAARLWSTKHESEKRKSQRRRKDQLLEEEASNPIQTSCQAIAAAGLCTGHLHPATRSLLKYFPGEPFTASCRLTSTFKLCRSF